jgi:hypothetical protein
VATISPFDTRTTQLELFNKRKRDRRQVKADLEKLTRILDSLRDPATAKAISYLTGYNDRYIRHLAEMSDGRILGTDLGYELAEKAPESRFEQWAARYRSQIEKMRTRLDKTQRKRAGLLLLEKVFQEGQEA